MQFNKICNTIRYKMNCEYNNFQRKKALSKVRKEILTYYEKQKPESPEVAESVSYLKCFPLKTFCSSFADDYHWEDIQVFCDELNGLRYVNHQGKRLYFIRSYNERTVKYCYSGLLAEQDHYSPHCYLGTDFTIEVDDVLLDVGSAEGIFSLTHIEKLKHVVLFERDPSWVEALEATFAPWKDKVTVVRKYVSDCNDEENVTIDSYLSDKSYCPTFLKVDVEGAEQRVLDGMQNTLKLDGLKLAVCTYHQQDDFKHFTPYLTQRGFSWAVSSGVMIFLNDLTALRPPYFRKGLLRAKK